MLADSTPGAAMSLIWAVWFIGWTLKTGEGTAKALMNRHKEHKNRHITARNVPSLDNFEIAIGNCTG